MIIEDGNQSLQKIRGAIPAYRNNIFELDKDRNIKIQEFKKGGTFQGGTFFNPCN
jgi:hypothetical protein